MDKKKILALFIKQLEENLSVLINSAKEAKNFATDTEAKAENKYDTKGLEASYLAGAQAKRAKELADKIAKLKSISLPSDLNKVQAYALVAIKKEEEGKAQYYFILPQFGGWSVPYQNHQITSISLESPLLKAIIGSEEGESVDFQNHSYEIEKIL